MTNKFKDMGVEKEHDAIIETLVNGMSLFDGAKEEKAVSYQEREEDGYQLQQQSLHEQLKPMNGNGCNLQQSQAKEKAEDKNPDHGEQEDEDDELLELRKHLIYLRKRRRRIQQSTRIECVNQKELLLERLNSRYGARSRIVDEYLSAWKGSDSIALFLDCAKRWNVLNDCFSIWIDGKSAFATINGCRLGAEADPLPTSLLIAARGQHETKSQGNWVSSATNNSTTNGNKINPSSPPRRSILGLFGSNNSANNTNRYSENTSSKLSISEPIRVPWLEVNAALGHACLLLKLLQELSSKRGGNAMKFTHQLHPMGATSRIGIRFGNSGSGTRVLAVATGIGSILSNGSSNNNENDAANTFTTPHVIYNLFFEEDSGFSFFKNNLRNFNWAMQAFLQCIYEAAAQQADKTIPIPHVIYHKKSNSSSNNNNVSIDNSANYLNGGEWTIGGLSICYPSHQQATTMSDEGSTGRSPSASNPAALEWTRACRFLLTDLKWLVAYAAKHVDR